ncbi:uncharacterized protein LOC128660086 isoform X2 [Bombina bombina]|nr:uncharacterized protein LOC128660086 isoform X2 [Bombina bombina]
MRPHSLNTEFTMRTKATLNLQPFKDEREVETIVKKCGLRILFRRGTEIEIEGEFQELRRFRNELANMISECSSANHGPHTTSRHADIERVPKGKRSPQFRSSGRGQHVSSSDVFPSAHTEIKANVNGTNYKASESHYKANNSVRPKIPFNKKNTAGFSARDHERNSPSNVYSKSERQPFSSQGSSLPPETTSVVSIKGNVEASQRFADPSSASSTGLSSESVSGTPSNSSQSETFILECDILEYINVFKKQSVNDILTKYAVDIVTATTDDLSYVTLKPKQHCTSTDFEKARNEISQLFTLCQTQLRTEDLNLKEFPAQYRTEIVGKIKEGAMRCGILSRIYEDSLHLIGFSKDTYEFMQQCKAIKETYQRKPYNVRGGAEMYDPRPPTTKSKNTDDHADDEHKCMQDSLPRPTLLRGAGGENGRDSSNRRGAENGSSTSHSNVGYGNRNQNRTPRRNKKSPNKNY